MVTFDRLPMRDVLVERLGWSEEDARAFLDVLETPTEHLATKDDIALLRAELDQVRAELNQVRSDGEQVRSDLDHLRTDVDHLRTDVDHLRTDVDHLRTDVDHLRSDVDHMRSDVDHMRTDIAQLRVEFREFREEERRERELLEQRILRYIDSQIEELDRRFQTRMETMHAQYVALLRTFQLRTYMLAVGLGGPIIGLLIALLARS